MVDHQRRWRPLPLRDGVGWYQPTICSRHFGFGSFLLSSFRLSYCSSLSLSFSRLGRCRFCNLKYRHRSVSLLFDGCRVTNNSSSSKRTFYHFVLLFCVFQRKQRAGLLTIYKNGCHCDGPIGTERGGTPSCLDPGPPAPQRYGACGPLAAVGVCYMAAVDDDHVVRRQHVVLPLTVLECVASGGRG